MKDNNRNSIRTVLVPSMYPYMLVRSDNSCLCTDCTRKLQRSLIRDLRSGYETTLKYLCLAETDSTIYCDNCSEGFSAYDDN